MRRLALLIGPFALVCVMATPGQVHATFPGANGLIVFTQGDINGNPDAQLFIANPDGSQKQPVPLGSAMIEAFGLPHWSPNGSLLLISHTFRLDNGECCLPFRPAIVKPDGTDFTQLEIPDAPFSMDCETWLSQTRLLCSVARDEPDDPPSGVFSIRASDGGDPVRLTTHPDRGFDLATDISPDGKQFVFLRFKPGPSPNPDRTRQVGIFVENTDGTGLRQIIPFGLADPHDLAWASWSPDGTRISSATKDGRLFVVRTNGTGLSMIHLQTGTTQYFAFEPHWSPDGTRILFGIFINGGEGTYSANPDGSDVKQITFTTDFGTFINGADWGTHPQL